MPKTATKPATTTSRARALLEGPIRETGIDIVLEATGIARSTLFRWFNGTGRMTDQQLDAIANACGLQIDFRPKAYFGKSTWVKTAKK